MYKLVILSLIVLVHAFPLTIHAADLTIAAGKTVTADGDLSLNRLIMEDGATLVAPPASQTWSLQAQQAVLIGKSYIRSSGSAGQSGANAPIGAHDTRPCEQGVNGVAGGEGGNGSAGTTMKITLGIKQLDHLQINARGGDGGVGGNGGNGAPGGRAKGCHGAQGGNGGAGGSGGDGGGGGDVTFRYWLENHQASVPITNYGEGLIIQTDGGAGGEGGKAGLGGSGGKGRFEKRTTNITVTREPGQPGEDGQPGKYGRRGADGRFRIIALPSLQR